MSIYWKIQIERFKRITEDKGIPPVLSLLLIVGGFIGLSEFLFYKLPYAQYVYAAVGFFVVNLLSGEQRQDFIDQCFHVNEAKRIRVIENLLLSFPFAIVLGYHFEFVLSAIVLLGSVLLVYVPIVSPVKYVLPTPFGGRPFEFIRGFRKQLLIFPFLYLLTYFSIHSENFNMSMVVLLISFIVSGNFYSPIEPEQYVWIHGYGARKFLMKKIGTAIIYGLILSAPIAIAQLTFFPFETIYVLAGLVVGLIYLSLFAIGKYCNFPSDMSISDGLKIAACIFFPPLAIFVIPHLFLKAKNNLTILLHD